MKHASATSGAVHRSSAVLLVVLLAFALLASSSASSGSPSSPGTGVLQAATEPAVDSQISIDGVVRNTGAISNLELAPGTYEVCFSAVPSYLTPDCQAVDVIEGATASVTGTFVPAGTVNVTTAPADLAPEVSIDGTPRDRAPVSVTVATGAREVCFADVAGYTTPPCETVDVAHDGSQDVTGTYEPAASSNDGDAAAPSPTNLLTVDQQAFGSDSHGWFPQGNTVLARDANLTADDVAGALKVTVDERERPDTTRTARIGSGMTNHVDAAVTAGTTYEGSVRVRPGSAMGDARCELRWYDASAQIIDTASGSLVSAPAEKWTPLTCAATAPTGAAFAALRVHVEDADYGQVFHIDDAWLVGTGQDVAAPASEPTAEPAPEPDSAPEEPTVTPETSPAPEPEPAPAPSTSSGDWPGVGNTGVPAGVVLKPSGSITTDRDGQVIEGLEVTGGISVRHNDVTIRNTRVLSTGQYAISVPHTDSGSVNNLLIEDVELRGTSGTRSAALVHYGDWTARRVQISGFQDGVKISRQKLLDSWIRNDYYKPSGSHNDAVQSVGGSDAIIRGNRIEGPTGQTSALILQTNNSPIDGYLIEDNLLSGGNFTVYIRDKGTGHGAPTNMTLRNNVWIRDSWTFGATSIDKGAGFAWSGNTYEDGGAFGSP